MRIFVQNRLFYTYILVSLIAIVTVTFLLQSISNDFSANAANRCSRDRPKLAVLVPYRNRFNALLAFVPFLSEFLAEQHQCYRLFLLHQTDQWRFNRAALINAGFALTNRDFDYFAIHDIDLLPLNRKLSYNYPQNGVFHVSSRDFHPKYRYEKFLGGILLIKREDFLRVNGMSNRYWGWGMEDDEFYSRIRQAKIQIERPPIDIGTNYTNTFKHVHAANEPKRDTKRCYNQKEMMRKRDRTGGLNSVKFELIGNARMTIDTFPIDVYNIRLECNRVLTPWCLCDQSTPKNASSTSKS